MGSIGWLAVISWIFLAGVGVGRYDTVVMKNSRQKTWSTGGGSGGAVRVWLSGVEFGGTFLLGTGLGLLAPWG